MASILRIPVAWSGGTGMPGVSVFYSVDGDVTAVAGLVSFFDAIKALIPSVTSITVPSSGDSISDASGELDGTWSGGSGGTVACTGGGDYFAGVGTAVVWQTGGIVRGRRVRGRTFIAPMISSLGDTNGTIDNSALSTISTAANTLAGLDRLVIWSRPSSPGGSDGSSHLVTAASVPDRATALRSRRF